MNNFIGRNVQSQLNTNMFEVLTLPLSAEVLEERNADRVFSLFVLVIATALVAQNCFF